MTFLKVEGFGKSFTISHLNQTIRAVEQIDFSIDKGEFIGITGKSGSGKSTILKSIYRTYLPDEGKILYDSEEYGLIDLLQAEERKILYLRKYEIGYVSQFLNVMPRTTSRELVEQSVLEMGKPASVAKEEAEYVLSHFELDRKLWDTYPNTFSGGEKLRLNIAMAAVKKPRLLLLDEPTASLDEQSKVKVRELIEKLKKNGTTLAGVFHDIEFMDGLCDKVFDMKRRQYTSEGAVI
ncbi:alpha-D-ribose 1-methylphosphonate 5-triphosphate synthase subunit PhnL [Cytobacillus horneckiae]|uniref:Phosphonate C-P lyase system protein PhnL n=1 Tax=Cytobacillus horneckiae TaxID=549687 RepID=A0A2N0ZDK6_9BACI|nr:ATP-binding cassette domain-containing protein [Cytobacillus horneckiae]NRG45016.1 ATP-binding cassette domain-containing protein [Bacillus sp. CRN 9]MBN6884925.1 ATP-binding cassette domain-containing protein [Cytobacillus horneckiae]MCM3179329.1 ATP-binding cassette domain-containing protein [Cytobacillus horneckiae]MEC1154551.1 ATP-binding cassette domain-containing protein [Cytobacillus horneckiae]MED2937886.1 ATP-binding cassette domain-containing protein [Cytobacillus horneckiae]